MPRRSEPPRRPLRRLAPAVAVAGLLVSTPGPARAGAVSFFEGSAQASVMSFVFHAPQVSIPLTITGGALESTVLATGTPQGFGTAGVFPVPLASSAGLVIPQVVPVLGTPIPEEIRQAFKSFDFTNTPYYCQAAFPPVKEGGDEAYCGGPAQRDNALGFTSATANGHVKASGALDDPLSTRTLAESRAQDATVPGLQSAFRNASARAVSGRSADGVPQSQSRVEIGGVDLLGAIVTLRDLTSETTVSTDGTPEGTAGATTFTMGSASLFGIPVRVGPDGLALAGQAPPGVTAQTLADRVNEAANVGGFTMRLFPAHPVRTENGIVLAESGSIEVSYTVATPTPVRIVQRFGYTRAAVNALTDTASAGDDRGTGGAAGGFEGGPPPATGHAGNEATGTGFPADRPLTVAEPLPGTDSSGWPDAAGFAASAPSIVTNQISPGPAPTSRSRVAASTVAQRGNPAVFGDLLARPILSSQRVQSLYLGIVAFTVVGALGFRYRRGGRRAVHPGAHSGA